MNTPERLLSRRAALQRLSAGALLSAGLWPGALRADAERPAGSFKFIAVNDTHCMSPECVPYLQVLVAQMKQAEPEFCLHAGDLTEKGEREHLENVKEIFSVLPGDMYPVLGNHDYVTQTDRRAYVETFRLRVNYYFHHRGWQFVGLDTTDGLRYEKTEVQRSTFEWLRDYLPRLNPRKPTVLFTHFPLGEGVMYRPSNADALLERFRDFNLQAVFNGHYHSLTERKHRGVLVTTNRCCALKRTNHDGSKQKGYFVCEARDGRVERTFVEYKPASASS